MQLQTANQQGFAPVTLDEAMRFSEMLSKSSMVPRAYQGKPEDILVSIQWGKEIGLAPLQALQNISVINGKPSVYGDAAMALVQASQVCEGVEEFIEGEGTGNPVAVCIARRKGRTPVTAKFSVEDAKRAGLWGKQGPWQAYPKRMLQMRARGFALRDAFPDVLKGLITAEEAADFPVEKDITPAPAAPKALPKNPLDALAPPMVKAREEIELPDEEPDPQQEHVEVEQVNQQLQEQAEKLREDFEAAGFDVVEVVQVSEPEAFDGFPLNVPGKSEPVSRHPTHQEWCEAYKELATKVAKAGKVSAAGRLEKLKQLRDVNELVINRLDATDRVMITGATAPLIKALKEHAAQDK